MTPTLGWWIAGHGTMHFWQMFNVLLFSNTA
jgi:hypothetical protein